MAPFFLPTEAGLVPKFIPTEKETDSTNATSSKLIQLNKLQPQSQCQRILVESSNSKNCKFNCTIKDKIVWDT